MALIRKAVSAYGRLDILFNNAGISGSSVSEPDGLEGWNRIIAVNQTSVFLGTKLEVAFRIPPERPPPNFAASWNVAPIDALPIVRYDAKNHQRSLDVMRWGLVPFWAKDIKVGFANINAKAESI